MMSRFQRDHFLLSVQHELSQFSPPVPTKLYSVHFVPVVDDVDDQDPKADDAQFPTMQSNHARQDHKLETTNFCWCDYHTMAMMGRGMLSNFYVIELKINPWNHEEFDQMFPHRDPSLPRLFKASDR